MDSMVALQLLFLVLLLVPECLAPLRASVQSKLQRDSINLILFGANSLIGALIAGGVVLILNSSQWTRQKWGLLDHLSIGPIAGIVVSVILLDIIFYGFHWLSHRLKFLWRFHRAHHSDLDLDATTSFRFHIGEVLITSGFRAIVILALGVPPAGLLISQTSFLIVGQFAHSSMRVPERLERWIRFVIITPPMHWMHHSHRPSEHHSNFGVVFSGWDRLFGTYTKPVNPRTIHLGLDEYSRPEDVSLLRFLRIPLDRV